jgi:hypothetical protein
MASRVWKSSTPPSINGWPGRIRPRLFIYLPLQAQENGLSTCIRRRGCELPSSRLNRFTKSLERDNLRGWQTFSFWPPLQNLHQNTLMVDCIRRRLLNEYTSAAGLSMIRSSAFTKLTHEDMPRYSLEHGHPCRGLSMFRPHARTNSIGIDFLCIAPGDPSIKGDSNS